MTSNSSLLPYSSVPHNEFDYSQLPSTSTQPPGLLEICSNSQWDFSIDQPIYHRLYDNEYIPLSQISSFSNQFENTTLQVSRISPYQNETSPYPVYTSSLHEHFEYLLRPTEPFTQRQNDSCEHRGIKIYCRGCRWRYCMTCLITSPQCQHDRFLVQDATAKAKKDNEILKRRFDTIFCDVSYRIRGAIESCRMANSLRSTDVITTGMRKNSRKYYNTLSKLLTNLNTVATLVENALRSANPWVIAIALNKTFQQLDILEYLNYSTYMGNSYEGINFWVLNHGERCISVQRSEINLYLYNRPIYGVPHPVVIKKVELSHIKTVGQRGQGDLEFCRPWGVACNAEGKVIVTDRSNDRIKVLDPSGNFLYHFGQTGDRLGELHRPAGVTVDKAGHIVVADKDNHRVQIFTMAGVAIRAFGKKGSRPGEFNYPYSVHSNSKGEILVSDSKNHRLQLFQDDGVVLRIFLFGLRLFSRVMYGDTSRDVCFTPTGKILVSDFETHQILKFESALYGVPTSFGSAGTDVGQFQRPQGIACDDAGNTVIADSKNHRIILMKPSGEMECIFSGTGGEDLNRPCGICITPNGRLIIVDMGNDRLLFL